MRPTKAQSEAMVKMATRIRQAIPGLWHDGVMGKHHRLYDMFGAEMMDALIEGGMLVTRTDYLLGGGMTVHLTEKGRKHVEDKLHPVTEMKRGTHTR